MGHKHSREQILDAALDAAVADGLSRLTFGRLAARIGVSDRIVVYYFPTKDALVTSVLELLGLRLQERIGPALAQEVEGHRDLVRSLWPLLADEAVDPLSAVYLEAIGLAAVGRAPYRGLAAGLVGAWVSWLTAFVTGEESTARVEAETAVAVIDGLLVIRHLAGAGTADRAAATLVGGPR